MRRAGALPGTCGATRQFDGVRLLRCMVPAPLAQHEGDWKGMKKSSASRRTEPAIRQPPTPDSTLYDDIEAAWLAQRPDLDLAAACTLLRLERVNQLHELRLQDIAK